MAAGAALRLRGLALLGGSSLLGGSVSVGARSSFAATDCLFADSVSLSDGGAVAGVGPGALVSLAGCSFDNCTALAGWGGAASVLLGAQLQLSGGSLTGCSAQSGGALGVGFNATALIADASITACSTSIGYGGGVTVEYGGSAELRNLVVSHVSSVIDGGGVFVWQATLVMRGSSFRWVNSGQGGLGGAVAVEVGSSATIESSLFEYCTSSVDGGALFHFESAVAVKGCVFNHNWVPSGGNGGGAIAGQGMIEPFHAWCGSQRWCSEGALTVADSVFYNNSVGSPLSGGAICMFSGIASLSVKNSSFINNTAFQGGGAISFDGGIGPLSIADSSFISNTASASGAVEVLTAGPVTLSGVTMTGNAALAAGASGGGLAYGANPATETCQDFSGETLANVYTARSDLQAAPAGRVFVPGVASACGWLLAAPPWAACTVNLTFTFFTLVAADNYLLTVSDVATGQQLFSTDGTVSNIALPPPVASTAAAGLLVWFNVSTGTTFPFQVGFQSSWRLVCPAGPPEGGASPAGGPSAPSGPPGPFLSDFKTVSVSRLAAAGNAAAGDGGTIYVAVAPGLAAQAGGSVAITDSTITSSASSGLLGGGAVMVGSNVSLSITTSRFANNSAQRSGGAVLALGSPALSLAGSTFSANEAGLSAEGGSGGAVACIGCGSLVAAASSFSSNGCAGDGGALVVQKSSSASLTDCSFSLNVAAGSAGRGGAASILGASTLTVQSSAFTANSMPGGASTSAALGVDSVSRFRAGDGGALFVLAGSSAPGASREATAAQVVNCTLSGNSARRAPSRMVEMRMHAQG